MTLRSLLHVLVTPLLGVVFFLFAPSRAHAQGLGLFQEQSLPRLDSKREPVTKRPQTLKPEGVSYRDCIEDQKIRFPLELSNFEGDASIEVWAGLAGADCKQQQNRTAESAVCWPVVTGVPPTINPIVDIPVREIMAGAPPNRPRAPVSDASICGKIDLTNISLQFLYFTPGQRGATPSRSKDVTIEVDTVGPAPPSGLKVLPGNGRIKVSWNNISGEGGVSVLTGVKVYCERLTGASTPTETDGSSATCNFDATADSSADAVADASTDAGADASTDASADASTDASAGDPCTPSTASTSGNSSCKSSKLLADQIPSKTVLTEHLCGEFGGNAGTSVYARTLGGKPLENGVTYAVAVAATDPFDNPGTLSTPLCEFPELTADFWEDYRDDGGDAGGGCTTSQAPVGPVAAIVMIVVATLATVRRRRQSRGTTRRIER